MKYRLLGKRTGLFVSEMVLGTGMFGTARGYGASIDDTRSMFDSFTAARGNFIDTSDAYQQGEAEQLIGKYVSGDRGRFIIASKFSRGREVNNHTGITGNHRKAMREAVEASLRRLKTDYIDLYFAHFEDKVTPIEEIMRGFEDLVSSGKILYTGLSNFPAWRAATAAVTAPLAAIQVEFSLLKREVENEHLPMAAAFGLGVMGYSPLAGGLLTGKYRQGIQGRINLMTGKQHEEDPRQKEILDTLLTLAAETGYTPGQITIAWAMTKDVFPIMGARTKEQFEDGLAAYTISLTQQQLSLLDTASQLPLAYPDNPGIKKILTQQDTIELEFPTTISV